MAHLIFPEIQDALVGDTKVVSAMVDAILKCDTASEARHLAEHLDGAADTIKDMCSMIDDIYRGRRDEYGDSDEDDSEALTPCTPPKYAPEWALVKRCEGTVEPVPLADTDLYVGRCPECGEPVGLCTEEFFSMVADYQLETLETGVFCPDCAAERKEMDYHAGTED